MKFGMAEIQAFLLQHVEKIVFGLAGLMVVAFIVLGLGEAGVPNSPDELQQKVNAAQSNIARSSWESDVKKTREEPSVFDDIARQRLQDTQVSFYELPVALNPPTTKETKKRTDPQIYPATDLEARAGNGTLAVYPKGGVVAGGPGGAAPRGTLPTLPPNKIELLPGYRAGGGMVAEGRHFIAVMALIPRKRQTDEFDSVFVDAESYSVTRDKPRYISYTTQRIEVKSADEKPVWEGNPTLVVRTLKEYMGDALWEEPGKRAEARWPDNVQEIVDPKYLDARLTFRPLPLMLRDLDRYLLHSKVERFKPTVAGAGGPFAPGVPAGPDPLNPGGDDPLGALPAPGAAPPGGVRPPPGAIREGGGGMMGDPSLVKADHTLLRFYDLNVESGKMYRYRVQLWIEDPNDPQTTSAGGGRPEAGGAAQGGGTAPPREYLDDTVVRRVAEKAKDPEATKYRHIFWRKTDWSEATPATLVPGDIAILAGGVVPPKEQALDRERRFKVAEPTGKLMVSEFSQEKARDVASEYDIGRGSQINFLEDGRALNPINHEIETLTDFRFITQTVVLDLRGGEAIPSIRGGAKGEMSAVGEILLMDEAGNLLVRDEAIDFLRYQDGLLKVPKAPAEGGVGPGPGPLGIPPEGGALEQFLPPVRPQR